MLDLSDAVRLACWLEASVRKPGNVSPGRDFPDLSYRDLIAAGAAIAPILPHASQRGIGVSVLKAVQATRVAVRSNANLGIILLLTPLCAAEELSIAGLRATLRRTDVADARAIYRAIRESEAGGLGQVAQQDVSAEPTIALVDCMKLAADRDTIARQYANGFADVFEFGLPALNGALAADLPRAILWCHLQWMSGYPDSLIVRKGGLDEANAAARMAARVLDALGSPESLRAIDPWTLAELTELDDWSTATGHCRNPGTSADLVAASLFCALRSGTIPRDEAESFVNSRRVE